MADGENAEATHSTDARQRHDAAPAALVISPSFFGYEQDVVNELRNQGYAADFLDERPSNSSFARALMRIRPQLIHQRIDKYYERAWEALQSNAYTLVLVIKGEVVPGWFLERVREKNPDVDLVFYTYDSLNNSSNCRKILHHFDRRFSFDRDDVAREPKNFQYLPLFFAPVFANVSTSGQDCKYGLSFIGTLHSGRYRVAKQLMAGRHDTFEFFYVQARWYFAMTKYVTREHRFVPWRDVSFSSMTKEEIASVFADSRAVLDVQRKGQSGLTMRTFEVLASRAILVTTNEAVKRESFYDESRVLVIDESWSGEQLSDKLLAMGGVAPPEVHLDAYSLSSWVHQLTSA